MAAILSREKWVNLVLPESVSLSTRKVDNNCLYASIDVNIVVALKLYWYQIWFWTIANFNVTF